MLAGGRSQNRQESDHEPALFEGLDGNEHTEAKGQKEMNIRVSVEALGKGPES